MRLHCVTSDNGEVPVLRVTTTGITTAGSPVVTAISDTSTLVGALGVTGTGVPPSTFVLSIDSASQVTLTSNATATGAVPLTFRIEPLNLTQAKSHLRVTFNEDDNYIAALVAAARRYVEVAKGQALLTQTWNLYLDSFPSAGGYYNRAIREVWPSLGGLPSGLGFYPGMVPNSTGVIDLPLPPVQSVNAVTYYDFSNTLQTMDPSVYNLSLGTPSRIQPQYSKVWPISRPTIDSVIINFTSGYASTSDKLADTDLAAVQLLIGHWYENREAVGPGSFATVPLGIESLIGATEHGGYY